MAAHVFQKTVFFSGHVQGVGFRYMTLQIAKEFDVSGWVKNLNDGRVELFAEGESSDVEAFTAEVADRLSSYIRKSEINEDEGPASCRGFTIAH